jgi:hypothetical protein
MVEWRQVWKVLVIKQRWKKTGQAGVARLIQGLGSVYTALDLLMETVGNLPAGGRWD